MIKKRILLKDVILAIAILIACFSLSNVVYATETSTVAEILQIEEQEEQEKKEEVYTSVLSTEEQEKKEEGNLTYASDVTNEMCNYMYWVNKLEDPDKVLMTAKEIEDLNQGIIDASGTNVFDLTQIQEKKTASERAKQLSTSTYQNREYYVDGKLINNEEYYSRLKQAMIDTGFVGDEPIQLYSVAVKRADLRAWPTEDVIGYSADDPDDEIESAILNVNEPFVVRAKCEVDGKTFYWGYANHCSGWVNGENIAFFENKQDWIDAWKVPVDSKDILVVTQDKITLEPSLTEPATSEVQLMIGTMLKLVPQNELPESISERGTWNNYVVYLPTRNENGMYEKQYALISQHYSVSIGYLPLTQRNLLKVAFSCLGNRYGWGGMLGSMDCTLYSRGIYECFGLEIPRNTTWQPKVPGKVTNISELTSEQKQKYIEKLPAGSILFFSGHAMVYVGSENSKNYVISATGKLSDSTGELNVKTMYSIILNPLTTRRANGKTWLDSLTTVLSPVPVAIEEEPELPEEPEVPEEPKQYPYLDGSNQTTEIGKSVILRIDADISLFSKLFINEKEVDSKNYTVTSGSTIITLSEEFTKTLNEGKYDVKAVFTDGGEAKTTFTLAKSTNEKPEENKATQNTQQTQNSPTPGNVGAINNTQTVNTNTSPKTGDNISSFCTMFVISIVGMIVTLRKIKSKFN